MKLPIVHKAVGVVFKKALVVLGFLSLLCLPVSAQNLGRVSGIITDSSGGVIAGAAVTVTDVERGITRNLTTDASGTYSAPNLIPGTYRVQASYMGFTPVQRENVALGVGGDVHVDLSLQPGQQTQAVTVTAEAPQVTTTNAQLSSTIAGANLSDLPIAGHNLQSLMAFRPGIVPYETIGPDQPTNGLRGEYNVYLFDGVMDQMAYRASFPLNLPWLGGPEQGVSPPADAIQEFNYVESPKAEYGWRPGGQVSIGIKSGTNNIHGSAFAIGRNTALTANNPFFTGSSPVAYEDFGASFGGPIKKDKLFYFLSYEGDRFNVGEPRVISTPTLASLDPTNPTAGATNSIPDALNAMIGSGHANLINPLSLNLTGCTITPAVSCNPSQSLFVNNTASPNYLTDFTVSGGNNNGVGKIDYHLNDHNSINGEFVGERGDALLPARPPSVTTQPYFLTPGTQITYVSRLVWTYIPNSDWVNDLRFGWDKSLSWTHTDGGGCYGDTLSPGAPNLATNYGYINGTSLCGMAAISVSGFASNQAIMGNSSGQYDWSDIFRILDNVSRAYGNHQIKFGGEWVHIGAIEQQSSGGLRGAIAFGGGNAAFPGATSLEDFLAAYANTASITVGNITRHVASQEFAIYAQDDWRIVPRLTLNLGLRYEHETPMHEADNLLANFVPGTASGLVQETPSNLLYSFTPWFLSPRFGFAYDLSGKGTTVLRGSFDIIQNATTYSLFFSPAASLYSNPTGLPLQNGPTTVTTPGGNIALGTFSIPTPAGPFWSVNTPIFSNYVSATLPACSNSSPCTVGGTEPRLQVPAILEWNLGIERAVTRNLTLHLNYVGNHGQHELGYLDTNEPLPGANGLANEQARRPYYQQYPWFSQIRTLGGTYDISNYNALQATLVQRVAHGLDFSVGYTYSHALDESDGDIGLTPPQDSRNPGAEYGNAAYDIPQILTVTGNYTLPGKKSFGQMLEGWRMTSTLVFWSGLPFNPTDTSDDLPGVAAANLSSSQQRWSFSGNPSDFQSLGSVPFPCYGAPGSTFAAAGNGCTLSTAAPAVWQECVSAANSEPNSPVGTGITAPNNTGVSSLNKLGCYVEGTSVIIPPAPGTFGNMSRNMFFGTPYDYWNLSVIKDWKLTERLNSEFRVEIYNVTNSIKFGAPNASLTQPSTFGASTQTPDVNEGSPVIGPGGPRRIQLGLKFLF